MRFKIFLEKSYSASDIPKFFYIATKITKAQKQLLTGVLVKLTGISESKNIINEMNDPYEFDLLIEMDGKELVSLNKLTRVMYDNPYYLAQDNMKAYRRVYGFPLTVDPYVRIIDFLYSFIYSISPQSDVKKWSVFKYLLPIVKIPNSYEDIGNSLKYFRLAKIKNLPDLAIKLKTGIDIIVNKFPEQVSDQLGILGLHNKKLDAFIPKISKLTTQDYIEWLGAALVNELKDFTVEKEWDIKDGKLKIPKKTKLYIREDCSNIKTAKGKAKWIEPLLKKYKVEYVDYF